MFSTAVLAIAFFVGFVIKITVMKTRIAKVVMECA